MEIGMGRTAPKSVPADGSGRGGTNVGETERIASTLGGGVLTALGLKRGGVGGTLLAGAGAALVYRGVSGHCPIYGSLGMDTARGDRPGAVHAGVDDDVAVRVARTTVIARPRTEVYAVWRDFAGLPRFMDHLERVGILPDGRSHWIARGPGGVQSEWDAELTDDRPGERIAWRTAPGADAPHRAEITFEDVHGGGTEVRLTVEYEAPGGRVGRMLAEHAPAGTLGRAIRRLLGFTPEQMVGHALERLRAEMEAPSSAGTLAHPPVH